MDTETLNLDKALKTPGWMSPEALAVIARLVNDKKKIIEVGSWKGRSARAMLDNSEALIYCVDTFKGQPDEPLHKEAHDNPFGTLIEFLNNLADGILSDRIMVVQGDSVEMAAKLAYSHGQTFDMVFIDANHSYEAVSSDIKAYKPLLVPGGILSGHDYNSTWHGVRKAVEELVPGFHTEPETSIWWVTV